MGESANIQQEGMGQPASDEQYCPSCGDVVKKEAAFCPGCGVSISGSEREDKSRLGFTGYAAIGAVSGLIAFILVPVVLGPISIFCGIQLYRKHSELAGILVIALGGAGLIIGMILGMMFWS